MSSFKRFNSYPFSSLNIIRLCRSCFRCSLENRHSVLGEAGAALAGCGAAARARGATVPDGGRRTQSQWRGLSNSAISGAPQVPSKRRVSLTQRKPFWAGCAFAGFLERSPRFGIEASDPRVAGQRLCGLGYRLRFSAFSSGPEVTHANRARGGLAMLTAA